MGDKRTRGGMSLSGVLTVIFIVLKLIGVINWSWLWVFAPLWILSLIAVAIVIITLAAVHNQI